MNWFNKQYTAEIEKLRDSFTFHFEPTGIHIISVERADIGKINESTAICYASPSGDYHECWLECSRSAHERIAKEISDYKSKKEAK